MRLGLKRPKRFIARRFCAVFVGGTLREHDQSAARFGNAADTVPAVQRGIICLKLDDGAFAHRTAEVLGVNGPLRMRSDFPDGSTEDLFARATDQPFGLWVDVSIVELRVNRDNQFTGVLSQLSIVDGFLLQTV